MRFYTWKGHGVDATFGVDETANDDLERLDPEHARNLAYLIAIDLTRERLPLRVCPYQESSQSPHDPELETALEVSYADFPPFQYKAIFTIELDESVYAVVIVVKRVFIHRELSGDRLRDFYRSLLKREQGGREGLSLLQAK